MGFEYRIRYTPADRAAWDAFIARLENPIGDGWPAFAVTLADDGILFCDYGRSTEAAVAFRRIVDEALVAGTPVVIEEV
ncbi:MAG TPA: hypothetical protein VF796_20945 [Humisphaera sp.]